MPRAPRRCQGRQGNCGNLIRGSRYCPDCAREQAWSGPRTASSTIHSTTAWKNARAATMATATNCALHLTDRCTNQPEEADLIIGAAHGGPITTDNMQAVCKTCHRIKTRRERDHC